MDDMESSESSTELEPLIIPEEGGQANCPHAEETETKSIDCSEFSFSAAQLNQSALIRPYLQEMDELLRSCEELTGITMDAEYNDTSFSVTQDYDNINKDSADQSVLSKYLSTSYIDTRTEMPKFAGMSSCSKSEKGSQKTDMPLTSAGNRLSDNLVEYEGQLLGMLAMLQTTMEETGLDLESSGQEYVHICQKLQNCSEHQLVPEQYEAEEKSQEKATTSSICERMNIDPKIPAAAIEMSVALIPADQQEFSKVMEQTSGEGPEEHMEESNAHEDILNPGSSFELGSNFNKLVALRNHFDDCIEQVQILEKQRRCLLIEFLNLYQPETHNEEDLCMDGEETEDQISNKVEALLTLLKKKEADSRIDKMKARQNLREQRQKEEQGIWKVILEREGLREELRRLKKRLFSMAWECAQSQAILRKQQSDVELLQKEEDKLQSLLLQLSEESSQLRSAHQQQLLKFQEQRQISSQTCSTHEEMTESKRHSCGDIQQYLKGGLHALEERYEPILMALLKRRDATTGALVKAKDQAQQLKIQMRPLMEEVQRLEFQRICLEEKLKLTILQRREELEQYKETVTCLEERSRELKTELLIQKRKRQDMEEIKETLTKQLLAYRARGEEHDTRGHNEVM